MIANIPPNKVPAKSAGIAGVFLMISAITNTGTKNNHALIVNELLMACKCSSVSSAVKVSKVKPIVKKMIRVIPKDYFIYVNPIRNHRYVSSDD